MNAPEDDIRALLSEQGLAVLATHRNGQPYTSLMAFAANEDLSRLYFATARTTRKATNLEDDPRAALLIDDRGKGWEDLHQCIAVTALGPVEHVGSGSEGHDLLRLKHPAIKNYLNSPSVQIYCLTVQCFLLVDSFQHVVELHLQ